MKKILCLLISILIMSSMVIGTQASSNLIFDLDFSSYDGTNLPVDNLGNTIKKTGTPAALSETVDNATNLVVKYISFQDKNSESISCFRMDTGIGTNLDNSTVEAWVKPLHNTANYGFDANERVLFSVQTGYGLSNSKYYASIHKEDGHYILKVNANGVSESVNIDDYTNSWTHFVFTREYKDGNVTLNVYAKTTGTYDEAYENDIATPILTKTAESTKADESNLRFHIGAPGVTRVADNVFSGGVATMRVYDNVLSGEEVAANYKAQKTSYIAPPPPPGAVFNLKIDTSANSIIDSYGDTITKNGGVTLGTYKGIGEEFDYVHFSDAGNVDKNAYLTFTGANVKDNPDITVEIWARAIDIPTSYWGNMFIFKENGVAHANCAMRINVMQNNGVDTLCFGYYGNMEGKGGSATAVDRRVEGITDAVKGKWAHYVLTKAYDEATNTVTFKSYVNGEYKPGNKEDSITNENVVDPLASENITNMIFGIGGCPSNANEIFKGDIAEFKVHNYELTEEEIKANFKNGMATRYYTPEFTDASSTEKQLDVSQATFNFDSAFTMGDDDSVQIINTNTDEALSPEDFSVNVSPDKKSFTLAFTKYFKYGDVFKIGTYSASALKSYNYFNITKGDIEVEVDEAYDTLSEIKTAGKVKFSVINTGTLGKECKYSVVARGNNGASISYAGANQTFAIGNTQKEISLTNLTNANEVIIYIWEKIGNNLIPVVNTPISIK